MSFAQIKAADAKCGNSTGGVFKDRRELVQLVDELAGALKGLHDDQAEYARINYLGGYENHWMVRARAALAKLERTE